MTRHSLDVERELLEAFEHSAKVTEHLVGTIPPRLWREAPPNGAGRTIAAIFAHMQGVRRTFAKMGGADPVLPSLERKTSTPAAARRALEQSREALTTLFRDAISQRKGRVKGMPRRTVNMMLYLIQHDAHHRGQISMLAHAMGHRLAVEDIMKIWGWKRLTSDATRPRP